MLLEGADKRPTQASVEADHELEQEEKANRALEKQQVPWDVATRPIIAHRCVMMGASPHHPGDPFF